MGRAHGTATSAAARGMRAACLVAALTAACGPEAPDGVDSPHQWLQARFLAPRATPATVVERFGEPDSRTASPTPNRHVPGQTDSIVTLEYREGLRIRFYSVTGGDALLQSATVSSPGIVDLGPVDVGTSWDAVRATLGPPSGRREGDPYYACADCPAAENPVFFELADDVVEAVRYTYYVD